VAGTRWIGVRVVRLCFALKEVPMPLVINEVVSDVRIAGGSGERQRFFVPDRNPERDRLERLRASLRRERDRLTGRDSDDTQESVR
jgi:hypothetical protein